MTLNKLASQIAKREGKKSQVSIGNIREVIGILSDIVYEDGASMIWSLLLANGVKRAKKKSKLKKGKK